MTVDNDGATESEEQLLGRSPADSFAEAQVEFNVLLNRDFPDFTVEQYAAEKAAAEGLDREKLSTKLWADTKALPSRLDLSGDGKLGLDDVNLAAKQAAGHVGRAWKKATATGKDDVADAASSVRSATVGTGKKIAGFDYLGAAGRAARKTKDTAKSVDADTFRSGGRTLARVGKTASGVQGIQNRREARGIKEVSEEYANAAEELTEQRRVELYAHIEEFGQLRLEALQVTLSRFLKVLEALKQNNRAKEYELLDGIGIDTKSLEAMGNLEMTVAQSLRATAATGALGVAAVLGTPALVTGAVGALATASTGTAISTLSGVASTNAVLAWLGGGSLATGGGGMALGGAVLTGITVGATAGVTLLATGLLVSTHYARKLTEAKTYQKDVALAVASLENAWLVMDAIRSRVDELTDVTVDLRDRLVPHITQLEDAVPTFDAANPQHAALFNKCGLLVKTMVELAQVPLLGEDGELTDESLTVTTRVKKVLNTEV